MLQLDCSFAVCEVNRQTDALFVSNTVGYSVSLETH